jgi:hypothetical protein
VCRAQNAREIGKFGEEWEDIEELNKIKGQKDKRQKDKGQKDKKCRKDLIN